MSRVFLDTNVLAYGLDANSPEKRAIALSLDIAQHTCVISTQVMLEVHSVLTRKFSPRWSGERARRVLNELTRYEVVPADADLVLSATQSADDHQLSLWDAMIVEAARLANCQEVWTEDLREGAVIRGVRIVNPFAGVAR